MGDAALVTIGRILEESVRSNDLVGRIGGEEFAILLPGVEANRAALIAERIRHRLENAEDAKLPKFTASFGVSQMTSDDTALVDIVKRADAALYQAKHAGRNKTIISTPSSADHFILAAC